MMNPSLFAPPEDENPGRPLTSRGEKGLIYFWKD